MTETLWQQRIRRAEYLSGEFPFARQILGFYLPLARFQQQLFHRFEQAPIEANKIEANRIKANNIEATRIEAGTALDRPPELPKLLSSFPEFLALVQKHGSPRLIEVARILRQAPPQALSELLDHFWSTPGQTPADPSDFLALAFLQPYAEFVRSRVPLHLENYTHAFCPFCGRRPAQAALRPLGEGARRHLLCGFCLCEW